MKKRTVTLHLVETNEPLVFTKDSFDCAYSRNGQVIVTMFGGEFTVQESCKEISELLDSLED